MRSETRTREPQRGLTFEDVWAAGTAGEFQGNGPADERDGADT
jgi:hypothetical protein